MQCTVQLTAVQLPMECSSVNGTGPCSAVYSAVPFMVQSSEVQSTVQLSAVQFPCPVKHSTVSCAVCSAVQLMVQWRIPITALCSPYLTVQSEEYRY